MLVQRQNGEGGWKRQRHVTTLLLVVGTIEIRTHFSYSAFRMEENDNKIADDTYNSLRVCFNRNRYVLVVAIALAHSQ